MPKNSCIMQIWAEPRKSALPICNYSQILYQFLTFTQNLKRSQHVRTVDPEIGKDIDEVENISSIVSAMVEQRTSLGLSQRELAAMCGIPQSSVARIESCKTTPNLGTLLNIFQHLGLQLTVRPTKPTV